MADVNIIPLTAQLTDMQTAVFQATDAAGAPVAVSWAINPAVGTIDPAPAGRGTSATGTYTAPQQVSAAQSITVTATSPAGASASATIFLTPIAVTVTPASVELKINQKQQFAAVVAADPANRVTWNISPQSGIIDNGGLYTPDPALSDNATISVIATSALGHKTGTATIKLAPPPWTGWPPAVLGIALWVLFVFLCVSVVGLWPLTLADSQAKQDAQNDVAEKSALYQAAEDAAKAATPAIPAPSDATAPSAGKARAEQNKNPAVTALPTAAETNLQKAKNDLEESTRKLAQVDKDAKAVADAPCVKTRFANNISREIDLLLLVLLGGALGASLHAGRSFVDFSGNRELKKSWLWWYCLQPWMGAILALIFYMALRGGFLAITSGANPKTADLSPFALTSIAALVGLFSKQATTKLSDIFNTMFKPDDPKQQKDALHPTASASPAGTPGTTGAPAAGFPVKQP